jgi:hypothetical protein
MAADLQRKIYTQGTLFDLGELTGEIRSLPWRQPYGSLMLHGKVETREWYTPYRGLVLMRASKRAYNINDLLTISGDREFFRINEKFDDWTRVCLDGQAFALGRLIDCRPMRVQDENACFAQYRPGLFCHVYRDVREIEPFPCKGAQKWGTVGPEYKALIKFK